MNFLSDLNDEQKEVVTTTEGIVLVLAGAGSGKTRSIIYRTAYLIKEKKISPWNILIVTFTNKAAKELKYRLKNTFMIPADTMWVGTFHSVCSRILRYESAAIDYDSNFSIFDEKDQATLLKKIIKELNIDTKKFPISKVKAIISREKNNLILPEDFYEFHRKNFFTDTIYKIFNKYQKSLKSNNAMDFDDLLLNTAKLFYENETIREKYSEKFKYVMIDEYQDTNYAQFKIINLIVKKSGNLCVVGDDDQAIYGWRGADIRNILEFEKDYKNVKKIKLEMNYRSTKQILDTANSLIKHNEKRHSKTLLTHNSFGSKPIVTALETEYDEAKFIAEKISELLLQNFNPSNIAIFYRTNAQSRVFEKIFTTLGIKYKLVGAINFYARKEIKDILAYLRILINPNDDISLLRIINFPRRGIGNKAISYLTEIATKKNISLQKALLSNLEQIPHSAQKRLIEFRKMLSNWLVLKEQTDITTLVEEVIKQSGIEKLYASSDDIQDVTRWENIQEFIASVEEFRETFEDENEPTLQDYLNQVSLQTSFDRANEDNNDAVSLMTIHNAKGLEFECVFISGVEEGLLPHIKSLEDNTIEEERRLLYVAITRAKQVLFITYAKYRRFLDTVEPTIQSRFINEIDEDLYLFNEVKTYSEPIRKSRPRIVLESDKYYKIGERIHHKKFGNGIIINVEGKEKNAKLTISFDNGELKKIIGTYIERI